MNIIHAPLLDNSKKKNTILLVEDQVDLRYTLAEWLRMHEYNVLEAATADEAMEVLRSSFAIDLIVTDVHMPGTMNGLDLAHHVSTAFPTIKMIVVSGKAEQIKVADGIALFRKPYDLKKITQSIENMLGKPEPD